VAHHALNNYVAAHPVGDADEWLETLSGHKEGTPEPALRLARKILGDGNVHTFTR
jgi:hypothetical protein